METKSDHVSFLIFYSELQYRTKNCEGFFFFYWLKRHVFKTRMYFKFEESEWKTGQRICLHQQKLETTKMQKILIAYLEEATVLVFSLYKLYWLRKQTMYPTKCLDDSASIDHFTFDKIKIILTAHDEIKRCFSKIQVSTFLRARSWMHSKKKVLHTNIGKLLLYTKYYFFQQN